MTIIEFILSIFNSKTTNMDIMTFADNITVVASSLTRVT
jgi:hypothetical protein